MFLVFMLMNLVKNYMMKEAFRSLLRLALDTFRYGMKLVRLARGESVKPEKEILRKWFKDRGLGDREVVEKADILMLEEAFRSLTTALMAIAREDVKDRGRIWMRPRYRGRDRGANAFTWTCSRSSSKL